MTSLETHMSETEQFNTLLATVEAIRAKSFPEIPAPLVRQVLISHATAAGTETDLIRELERLVDSLLASKED